MYNTCGRYRNSTFSQWLPHQQHCRISPTKWNGQQGLLGCLESAQKGLSSIASVEPRGPAYPAPFTDVNTLSISDILDGDLLTFHMFQKA